MRTLIIIFTMLFLCGNICLAVHSTAEDHRTDIKCLVCLDPEKSLDCSTCRSERNVNYCKCRGGPYFVWPENDPDPDPDPTDPDPTDPTDPTDPDPEDPIPGSCCCSHITGAVLPIESIVFNTITDELPGKLMLIQGVSISVLLGSWLFWYMFRKFKKMSK